MQQARQRALAHAQGVEQGDHVGLHAAQRVRGLVARPAGQAEAAQVGRDHAPARAHQRWRLHARRVSALPHPTRSALSRAVGTTYTSRCGTNFAWNAFWQTVCINSTQLKLMRLCIATFLLAKEHASQM